MRVTIGVDVGGTKIDFGAVDETGTLLKTLRVLTKVSFGPKAVIEQIVQGIKELSIPFDAIGVGIAGQVNRSGVVTFSPNLFWEDVPLKQELVKIFSKPTVVVNDVRAAAFAEWRFGESQGCQNLLCVIVGTGIGGAAVLEGKLIYGANDSALEVGHMQIDPNGPLCTCGSRGCFEAFVGGWALKKNLREDAEVFDLFVRGFVSLVNIFNPQRLILGGGVIQGLPQMIEVIRKGIKEKALKSARGVEVLPLSLPYPTLLGAAFIENHD
jgi:glucokinase